MSQKIHTVQLGDALTIVDANGKPICRVEALDLGKNVGVSLDVHPIPGQGAVHCTAIAFQADVTFDQDRMHCRSDDPIKGGGSGWMTLDIRPVGQTPPISLPTTEEN